MKVFRVLFDRTVTFGLTVIVLSAALWSDTVSAQRVRGVVSITSDPSDLPLFIDDRLVGRTPLIDYSLPSGSYLFRITRPETSSWDVLDWQREVTVSAEEATTAHAVFVGPVVVRSDPFGAEVYMNSLLLGTTPIRLANLTPGPYTIALRKSGFQETLQAFIVRDTLQQVFDVTLAIESASVKRSPQSDASTFGDMVTGRHRLSKKLGYATLGLGLLFTGMALNSDRKADQAYSNYLRTADPTRSEGFYQRAASQDSRTSTYAVAAQINFAGAFYFFLSRAFHSR
ncbi:MAG: PEGA domain-containing protein [Candidatus Latescibacteria bacterium]|jgi:hypothetical protein|nr:PEGA domain-containing protein [Candidatus Latescibacterota bacterium]